MQEPIVSVEEARSILGKDAKVMTDEEVKQVIDNLDEMAKLALLRKRDARDLASLIYDIYSERKHKID